MSKIFLATHGKMASGMKSSINLLMGDSKNLVVYDAYVDGDNDSLEDQVENFLTSCDKDETKILISDMYGGSVNQVLARYSMRENVFVVTGITLSLLLEFVAQSVDNFTKDKIQELISCSREMTKLILLEEVENESEDDFF